jgi:hypothetical protein
MARQVLANGQINAIFIDPISLDLEAASQFVFTVRTDDPHIEFVLYLDRSKAEEDRATFYRGTRRRFSHYYTLDKTTPVAAFSDEVHAVVETCHIDLNWRMSTDTIGRLLEEVKRAPRAGDYMLDMCAQDISNLLGRISKRASPGAHEVITRSVFLSHRFAEVVEIGTFNNQFVTQATEFLVAKLYEWGFERKESQE